MRRLNVALVLAATFAGTTYAGAALAPSQPKLDAPAASVVAVTKARSEYRHDTGKQATHWDARCRRPAGGKVWRCTAHAWRGAYRGTYKIRVRNGVARITDEGYIL